jgi:hypothetical protein
MLHMSTPLYRKTVAAAAAGGTAGAIFIILCVVFAFFYRRRRNRRNPPASIDGDLKTSSAPLFDSNATHSDILLERPSTILLERPSADPPIEQSPAVTEASTQRREPLTKISPRAGNPPTTANNIPAAAPPVQNSTVAAADVQLTDEELDFIRRLGHVDVPAADIARLIERMKAEHIARSEGSRAGISSDTTSLGEPPSYNFIDM